MEQLRLFQAKLIEVSGGHQPTRQTDLEKCNITDVLKAVDGATARSSTRKGASVRGFVCTIGKYSPIMKQWLSLLPQGDYGSGICGKCNSSCLECDTEYENDSKSTLTNHLMLQN
jgi:hypothetical protein